MTTFLDNVFPPLVTAKLHFPLLVSLITLFLSSKLTLTSTVNMHRDIGVYLLVQSCLPGA